MQLLNFAARADVYQNVPVGRGCSQLVSGLDMCAKDAVVLIVVLLLLAALALLTLVLHLRSRLRSIRRVEERALSPNNPPPYSSIGFPPSSSSESALHRSPSLSDNPYHVVAPSLEQSLLLKDNYFSHVPYPDRAFVLPSLPTSMPGTQQLPNGAGLGFDSTLQTSPTSGARRSPVLEGHSRPPALDNITLTPTLTSPPPAYAPSERRR